VERLHLISFLLTSEFQQTYANQTCCHEPIEDLLISVRSNIWWLIRVGRHDGVRARKTVFFTRSTGNNKRPPPIVDHHPSVIDLTRDSLTIEIESN